MGIQDEDFKRAMGAWPSGVTIVTSRAGERIHGMTVSDFCGASLEPPLVSVCCNRESNTTALIAEGRCFAVNVLAADQVDLSNRFASKKTENTRFEGLDCREAKTGAPLLPGAVVQIDCSLEATYDAGDHVIYLGRVEAVEVHDREPLLYAGGSYRRLAEKEG